MKYKINWLFPPEELPTDSKEAAITEMEKGNIIARVEQTMWNCGKFDPSTVSGTIIIKRNGTGFSINFKSIKPDDISEAYFNDLFDGYML